MHGPELARVGKAGRSDKVGQRRQGVVVELAHACGLVVDHDRPLTPRILGRNAGGTTIGVTGLRLHAAEREHEAARCVAPIGAEREQPCHVEAGNHPSARSEVDSIAESATHEAVASQDEPLAQRRADVVDKFERRRAGSALGIHR